MTDFSFVDEDSLSHDKTFRDDVISCYNALQDKPPLDITGQHRVTILKILTLTGQAYNGHSCFSRPWNDVEPIDIAQALELEKRINVAEILALNQRDFYNVLEMVEDIMDNPRTNILVSEPNRNYDDPNLRKQIVPPFGLKAIGECFETLLNDGEFDPYAFIVGMYLGSDVMDNPDERRNAVNYYNDKKGFNLKYIPHQGRVLAVNKPQLKSIGNHTLKLGSLSKIPVDESTLEKLINNGTFTLYYPNHHFTEAQIRDNNHTNAYVLFEKGNGSSDIMTLLYIGFTYGISAMIGAVVADASDTFGKFGLALAEFDDTIGKVIREHPNFKEICSHYFKNESVFKFHKASAVVFGTTYRPNDYSLKKVPSGSTRYLNMTYGVSKDFIRKGRKINTVLKAMIEIVENADAFLENEGLDTIPDLRLTGMRKAPRLQQIASEFIDRYKYFLSYGLVPYTQMTKEYYSKIKKDHAKEICTMAEAVYETHLFVDRNGYSGFANPSSPSRL